MENELLFRYITSVLVIISLPPLVMLLKELYTAQKTKGAHDAVQIVLFVIYITFLLSGIITLYINIYITFLHEQIRDFTQLALFRNALKQVGIVFVSWKLYFITRERK